MDNRILIQLNSGDNSAISGNASQFFNQLSSSIILDNARRYEVAVVDAYFPIRQITKSVYINSNLINGSRVGSQMTSTLLWIPFSLFDQVTIGHNFYYVPLQLKWYPLSVHNISKIDISFTDSTGAFIPQQAGDYSTVTIAIREITV